MPSAEMHNKDTKGSFTAPAPVDSDRVALCPVVTQGRCTVRTSRLLLLAFFGVASLFAQGNRGSITGTVTDPAGAVVAVAALRDHLQVQQGHRQAAGPAYQELGLSLPARGWLCVASRHVHG
jgi:hypothetical protein